MLVKIGYDLLPTYSYSKISFFWNARDVSYNPGVVTLAIARGFVSIGKSFAIHLITPTPYKGITMVSPTMHPYYDKP